MAAVPTKCPELIALFLINASSSASVVVFSNPNSGFYDVVFPDRRCKEMFCAFEAGAGGEDVEFVTE